MSWLLGRTQRPVQALTGVSSDYYNDQDFSHLPVAVAVPVGSEDALTAVPIHNPTTSRPPPINPDFQKGSSSHRSDHSFGAAHPTSPSTAPPQNAAATSRTTALPIHPLHSQPVSPPTVAHVQTVTIAQQSMFQPMQFKRKPMRLSYCPFCGASNTKSRVETFPSWKTWLAVAAIFVVFWPLAWVPLVVDCMKTTSHFCTTCHAMLGSVYPFDDCCVKRRR